MITNCDVVVVGAGIVGAACGWFLRRAGLSVIVVERGGIAAGTTSAGMGHLMVASDAQLHALTRRGVDLWHELQREVGGLEWIDTGVLYAGEQAEDLPLLERLGAEFSARGEQVELVRGARLVELEPGLAPDLPAALWQPRDAVLFPPIAAGRLLAASGLELRLGCAVTGFEFDGQRGLRAVQTTRGRIGCAQAVLAAGLDTVQLAAAAGGCALPIVPRRGDLAVTPARTTPVRRAIVEVGYLRLAGAAPPVAGAIDPGGIAVNVQPQMRGTCLIGSTRQFAGETRRVGRDLLQQVLARAARFVPALARLPIVRTWSGLRPYPLDHRPLIGPLPGANGILVAAGHEGLGITMAPATGELIAAMAIGALAPLDARPFLPARCLEAPAHG